MQVNLYDNFSDPPKYEVCDVPFTLSSDTFERKNYVIYAWSTTSDGKNGKSYKSGEEIQEGSSAPQNLYAQWKSLIPAYRIPIYGNIQCIDYDLFECNGSTKEFSPIVVNNKNELAIDIEGHVVPFKYSTVDTNENINNKSIMTEGSNWKVYFNGRYHIYDGDLPYIDIQLLCQCNENYRLPTSMFKYDLISFNNGVVSGNGSNSVTAANLSGALNNLIGYLKTNSMNGDKNFWTEAVKVTK